ncbi:thiol-activated cytolysin family protein [Halorientalis halophila]|uniref:thiol-activated cytolysin family protein n=1 Tax=Halorientalis halophila TaxID=3108499 RepID=UPI00300988E6
MTGDDENTHVDRRTLLGSTATLGLAATAGCLGLLGLSEEDEDSTASPTSAPQSTSTQQPTSAPTPVTTVRDAGNDDAGPNLTLAPCVADGSCVVTPDDDVVTDPDLFQPNLTVDPIDVGTLPTDIDLGGADGGGDDGSSGSLRDPTTVTGSGAVEVEVTPDSKQPSDESAGAEQTETKSDVVCTTQKRRLTAGGPANFLMDPQIGTIWPGAILEANSIANGQFSPALSQQRRAGASVDDIRQPIELSLSLMNVENSDTSVTVQNPSLGNVRNARSELLSRFNRTATPAKQKARIHQVHSEEQLKVALGVHYDSNNLDIDNEFDYSSDSETNKLLAKYWQIYYTLDVSVPNPVANGFVTDQGAYLNRNDVIIKNVSYGRLLLFSAESKYQRTKVSNSLKAALNYGKKEGKISTDVEHEQVLRDTKIDVQVMGGSAESGAKTISKPGEDAFETIKNWIQRGATYDPKTSPGVPISYHSKYLSNLDTANVYLTTSYTSRNCRPTTNKYRVHNFSWEVLSESDPGNEEELYGDIYVVGWPVPKDGVLIGTDARIEPKGAPSDGEVWDRSKSSHLNLKENQRKQLTVDETLVFDDIQEIDQSKAYIQVTAVPHEKDPTSNDDFGNKKHVKWFLNEAPSDPDTAGNGPGKFKIRWNDHGSEIELAFDISPLPP